MVLPSVRARYSVHMSGRPHGCSSSILASNPAGLS